MVVEGKVSQLLRSVSSPQTSVRVRSDRGIVSCSSQCPRTAVSPPSVFITRGLTFVPGVRVDWRGCRQMPILTVFCPPLRCCSFVLSLVTTVCSRVLLSAGVRGWTKTQDTILADTRWHVQFFESGLSKPFCCKVVLVIGNGYPFYITVHIINYCMKRYMQMLTLIYSLWLNLHFQRC